MSERSITPQEGLEALRRALDLVKRSSDARGRAYRRTPGTATFQKEWDKSDEYAERADRQFAIVEAALCKATPSQA